MKRSRYAVTDNGLTFLGRKPILPSTMLTKFDDRPALRPPGPKHEDWRDKVAKAKDARDNAKRARQGKSPTFGPRRFAR